MFSDLWFIFMKRGIKWNNLKTKWVLPTWEYSYGSANRLDTLIYTNIRAFINWFLLVKLKINSFFYQYETYKCEGGQKINSSVTELFLPAINMEDRLINNKW